MDKLEIFEEMVQFIDDYSGEFPDWWYEKGFTTEEFGDEMLSPHSWWKKKKEQLAIK